MATFPALRSATDHDVVTPSVQKRSQKDSPTNENQRPHPKRARGDLSRAIQKLLVGYLSNAYPRFELESKERIFAEADKAASDSAHVDLFSALTLLEKNKKSIKQLYFTNIQAIFQLLENGVPKSKDGVHSNKAGKLELVGKEDFDEWVAIVGLARALENHLTTPIHLLKQGLGALYGFKIPDDINPMSPYNLIWAYKSAIEDLGLPNTARGCLYQAVHDLLLANLVALYKQIIALLGAHGIKPGLPKPISNRQTESPIKNDALGTRTKREKRRILDRLASVISPEAPAETASSKTIEEAPFATTEEVIDSIDRLSSYRDRTTAEKVQESLARSSNSGVPLTVDAQKRSAIDTTEALVAELKSDESIGSELADLIADLRIPLIKESVKAPALLDSPDHPAKKLLQAISNLAPYLSSSRRSPQQRQLLASALNQISTLARQGKRVDLDLLSEKVEQLVGSQKDQFDENLGMAIQGAKAEERGQQAEEIVTASLCEKLENRSIPILIENLLQLGWAGLLVRIAEEHGEQSDSWKTYTTVLNLLLKSFQQQQSDSKRNHLGDEQISLLIKTLKKGIEQYPVHSTEAEKLIDVIESALREPGKLQFRLATKRVSLSAQRIKELVVDQAPPSAVVKQRKVESTFPLFSRLNVGDWVVERASGNEVRLLNFAWKNSKNSRFVFVDGAGNKALDSGPDELVALFNSGTCSLLENGELPLVERTVHRLLKNGFEQIRQASERDELTGLRNRKAFEREVGTLINTANTEGSHHLLVVLDIDQFNTVNDICGMDGGDGLLTAIANILTSYSPPRGSLARLGDDEFGILIENCTVDRGFQAAETIRLALEQYKYTWGDTSLSITVSIGIASIDSTSDSVANLLIATSAACSLAKNAGRNCCRIYQPTEHEFTERRRLIKSIPEIEDALEKNRLKLFTQLIAPVFLGEGDEEHHEVLLRIVTDDGKLVSPVRFIQAAEKYDRMRGIDRWVVDAFFDWLEKGHEKLADKGGFSINLSAQSLTDVGFTNYLKQKIEGSPYSPTKLAFEITETALITNMNNAQNLVGTIKELGCQFYLDDFGSGYSSYSYLKDFPVDAIKIDGVFVKDILEEKSSYAMVKSITEIAHHMDKKVIAEFVESEAVLIALRELEVDFAQGYGVGRPMALSKMLVV